MAKVFISYTSRDPVAGTLARLIHDRLAEAGIESFLDLSKIAPGREVDTAIRLVLPDVETLIMVISASSEDSKWMMAECMYAFEHDTVVIPVLAEPGIDVPFPFNRLLRLDFADRFEEDWPRLIELLEPPARQEALRAQQIDRQEAAHSPPDAAGAETALSRIIRKTQRRAKATIRILAVVFVAGMTAAIGAWMILLRPDPVEQPTSGGSGLQDIPDRVEMTGESPFENGEPPIAAGHSELPVPDLVEIPAGSFMMGSTDGSVDETPIHRVSFSAPFYLSKTEITFAHYDIFAKSIGKALPEDGGWGRGDRPVINVSWYDARDYASWLGKQTDSECRLPSEAEWEYAARAGTEMKFALPAPGGGNELSGFANCADCGRSKHLVAELGEQIGARTLPVKSFQANAWGVYDIHGNVWERVEDCWHENYDSAPDDGRAWLYEDAGFCDSRVLRGGSWYSGQGMARSANRNWFGPDDRNSNIGFRVLCSSPIGEY